MEDTVYRVIRSDRGANAQFASYERAAAEFVEAVNDPHCGCVELWEINGDGRGGGSAMELGKFKRSR